MGQWRGAFRADGRARLGDVWRIAVGAVALLTSVLVFSAPTDVARGLAWLQAQVSADGSLKIPSFSASEKQAGCETATTLQRLAGSSSQLTALLAKLTPTNEDTTESLACWQQLRQKLGLSIDGPDAEKRRVAVQGYAAYEAMTAASAIDTAWALAARLQKLSDTERGALLSWLKGVQATDGSFATAGKADLLATAGVLRGIKDEVARSSIAAAIASKSSQWLIGQRQSDGTWARDVAVTSLVFEAMHPYSGVDPAIASNVESFLLAQQQPEGSWSGDPYVTAVALRALALTSVAPVDPILAAAASVRGVVTQPGGQPLSGVTVVGTPTSGAPKSAVTDANGGYLVQGITPGGIVMSASLSGYQTATSPVTLNSSEIGVFSPTLYPAGTTPPAGASIKGTVQAFGTNAPLAGAAVQLAGPSTATASTDASGTFGLQLSAGTYTVTYSLSGYSTLRQQIMLTDGSVADLGTTLMRTSRTTSSLRGTISDFTGAPISGALVTIEGIGSTTANSAGAYTFSDLEGSQFSVRASASGYSSRTIGLSAPQPADLIQDFHLAGASTGFLNLDQLALSPSTVGLRGDITATALISNTSAALASGVAIALISNPDGTRVASLPGLDSSGNPVETITLQPGEQRPVYFEWNSGAFAPGSYDFTAAIRVPGNVTPDQPDGMIVASSRQPLTVTAGVSFVGSVTASPPVLRAGTGATVKLSALIQNAGNVVLPAQDYQLKVVDTKTGQATLTQTVSTEAIGLAQLRSLQFPDWTPSAGGNFRLELSAPSSPGPTITKTVYVGDSASATFSVDRQFVPSGTQTVRGTIKVLGQDSATGTITDPLAPLVRQAVTTAVKYADTYAYNHYVNDLRCYACHVQAQAVKGGELNLRFTQPQDPLRRAVLASSITEFQENDGAINDNGPLTRVTNTTLGLWGLADWHDPAAVALTRARMAQYLVAHQQAGGFWEVEENQSWWGRRSAMTALTVQNFGQLKKYLLTNPAPKTKGYAPVYPNPWINAENATLRAGSDGTLYIANWWYGFVAKMTPTGATSILLNGRYQSVRPLPDGRLLLASTSGVHIRETNGTMHRLTDLVARDAQPYGDKFLVTSYNDATIYTVDQSGNVKTIIEDSSLGTPGAVNVLADGSILISASEKIVQYSSSGQRIRTLVPRTNGSVLDATPYRDGFLVATTKGVFFYNKEWVGERWLTDRVSSLAAMPDGQITLNQSYSLYRLTERDMDTAGLIASMGHSVDQAYTWLLSANSEFSNNNNLDLAFRLMGLASVKSYDGGVSRSAAHDALIQSLVTTLRSRQRADGGWVWLQGYHTTSDSMMTALVSMALDSQNPSPDSPEVRKAIELLLGRQQADGSWRSENGLATTPLLSSTWVEIWLPMMLDRLARLDAQVLVTFPANVNLSNPSSTPTAVVTAPDASATYTWQLKAVAAEGEQLGFDLTLKDMQVDEIRAVAEQANLVFKNSFVDGSVTAAIEIPKVAVGTHLTLSVATDKPSYTDADQAIFSAPVGNPGTSARDAYVRFTVLDASGAAVEVLPVGAAVTVPAGGNMTVSAPWPVAGVLAGSYQLQADLFSPAGLRYATATAAFTVTATQPQSALARIGADRVSYTAAQTVQLTSRVTDATSNTALENVQARTEVSNAAGAPVFSRSEAIAQLAPTTTRQYGYALPGSGLPAGSYSAKLQLLDAGGAVLAQSTTSFTVLGADVTGVGLTGQLQATPATVYIGQATQLTLQATNGSTTALANVPVTVRVVDPVANTVVASFDATAADWQPGQVQTFSFPWVGAGTHGQVLVAAASAQIAGKDVPLAQANLKILDILYTGTTAAVPSEVEAGDSAALNYTVTNPAPVDGHMRGSLTVKTQSGQQLASWPLDLGIASGATYGGSQPYVTGEQPQTLGLELAQQLGANTVVLATNTFTVVDPPVPLGVTTGLKNKARFLVLVSCPPGLGAKEDAACVAQRSQAITSYLTALGYAAKTVSTGEAFLAEMRCGTYNTYWISNGALKLEPQTIGELGEAVRRGEALWMDGVHDSRNQLLHPTAGVKQVGKLSAGNQVAALADGGLYGAQALPTLGQPERFEATTGVPQGSFPPDSNQQLPVPAVVTNDWGSGKGLLFAFDLAAMVTADVVQANDQLTGFVKASASHAASGSPTLTLGDITQLAASVTNQGTRTVSFKAEATLPAGLQSISTEPAAELVTNSDGTTQATWNFTLAGGATQELAWPVKAMQTGSFGAPLSIYSLPRAGSSAPPKLRATATMSAEVKEGADLVRQPAASLGALEPTASSDKQDKVKALDAVNAAAALHAQANYEQAIVQWLAAADALANITSADTTQAKEAIALALEATTDALCMQKCGSATCQ